MSEQHHHIDATPYTLFSVLRIRTAHGATTFTIGLEGDLDLETVGRLRDVIPQACESACPAIHIDLSRLDFIDSSGIHAVCELAAAADAQGRAFSVTPGVRLRRQLEAAGVTGLLPRALRPTAWTRTPPA